MSQFLLVWLPGVGSIETVSPEGTFCDTVQQVPSGVDDMQLI